MPQIEKNQIIRLNISQLISDGNGIGFYEGFPVFVPESAPGDLLDIKVVKVVKSHGYGIIEKIISPSDSRIQSDCPTSASCGGCDFRHIKYECELLQKANFIKDNIDRFSGQHPEMMDIIPSPIISGYRNKAQFPIRLDKSGKIVAGFFAKRSHRIVPFTHCKLQPDIFGDIADTVIDWMEKAHVSPYDETANTGIIRHVYIRENYDNKQMVCLVATTKKIPFTSVLVKMLTNTFPSIESIIININRDNTNVIMGKECFSIFGNDYIEDRLCGTMFRISPLSFLQVNRQSAELLYNQAIEFANPNPNDILVDLYCGTGTIGLSMADKVSKLIGVEIMPQAVENAKLNAESNGITNSEFICADADIGAVILRDRGIIPNIIIVDPPRKGCSESLIKTIAQMDPEKVIMVSCNSATMSRDMRIFADLGYTSVAVRPVDMFPRTHHVESVVLMTRQEA